MKRVLYLGSCLALALATAGCQDQPTEPARTPSITSDTELSAKTARTLPYQLDRALKLPLGPLSDQYLRELASRAINPDDHLCPPSTPFVDFLFASLEPIDPVILGELLDLAADALPTVYSLLIDTEDTPQYFGYNGEYNHIMTKTERDIKRFWDIPSADIQLLAMHGTVLLDVDKMTASYQAGFTIGGQPIPEALARAFAEIVRADVLADPDLNGGNHPLFTFNAFAFSDFDGPIPDKIVMGDGVLDAFSTLGFEDVAPQGIYAHEFAHHIQYENGYFEEFPPTGATTVAELTRYTELMADAYAAYFLTHKRGLALNKHRVAQFLEVFFDLGDCAFANPGHHGTPNQRMRAAQFGFNVAAQAQKQGHILGSEQFHDLFVAEYPRLVAPDAT